MLEVQDGRDEIAKQEHETFLKMQVLLVNANLTKVTRDLKQKYHHFAKLQLSVRRVWLAQTAPSVSEELSKDSDEEGSGVDIWKFEP